MVASIGAIASPSQGVSYYERDGYYAKDDPDHRAASAWAGKGADALGLSGPVDPDVFTAILEGRVPDGPQLGRLGKDGEIVHRPGRDLTLSAPKSVSLAALVGGDVRVAEAHGRAVKRTLAWVEGRAVETRMKDPETGGMIRAGDQKAVIATFIHPNIADIYRRKVERLAEALDHPEDRDAAALAIRGLIEGIVLTPGEKWAEMDAVLRGDLGTILEWAGNGRENTKTDISMPEMSVSVVAGALNGIDEWGPSDHCRLLIEIRTGERLQNI